MGQLFEIGETTTSQQYAVLKWTDPFGLFIHNILQIRFSYTVACTTL